MNRMTPLSSPVFLYLLGCFGSVTTGAMLTNLWSFTGLNDGANPFAALGQGSDSNFYGATARA